jgi:hypothetical protein
VTAAQNQIGWDSGVGHGCGIQQQAQGGISDCCVTSVIVQGRIMGWDKRAYYYYKAAST